MKLVYNSEHATSKKRRSKLSQHFSIKDFHFIDENGKPHLKLSLGLVGALELLRSKLKSRINILKGYETNIDSKKIFKRNYHEMGLAADITADKYGIKDLFIMAETIQEIKGIGLNITENYVHIDTRKDTERKLWVEKDSEIIELTDENRSEYF